VITAFWGLTFGRVANQMRILSVARHPAYIVILTCCNKTAQALPQSVLLKDQQRQVFEQYVQDVLKRHLKRTFSLVQTFSSPVWLTQQMQQRYLTEFQMGSLQAD
jgi:hypothetical protein